MRDEGGEGNKVRRGGVLIVYMSQVFGVVAHAGASPWTEGPDSSNGQQEEQRPGMQAMTGMSKKTSYR